MLKSQTVIFRPYQRKLNYSVNIEIIDNCTQFPTTLQCEDHVKYLGVLLHRNLSWKFHIDNVALRANPCKNRPKSPIRGKAQKIKIALLLLSGRPK